MQDVHKNIDKYSPGDECKLLLVFDGLIADMINNNKLNQTLLNCLSEVKN